MYVKLLELKSSVEDKVNKVMVKNTNVHSPCTIHSGYTFHRHRYGFEIRRRAICRELYSKPEPFYGARIGSYLLLKCKRSRQNNIRSLTKSFISHGICGKCSVRSLNAAELNLRYLVH